MSKPIVSLAEVRQMHAVDRPPVYERGVLDYRATNAYSHKRPGPGTGPAWVLGSLVCRMCELRWDAIHPEHVQGAECPRCAALAGYDTAEHDQHVHWLGEQGLKVS